jgi:signal transduction histidine kinase
LLAVAAGSAYAVFYQAAFWFQIRPAGTSALFEPAGLAFAVLFLAPRRTWPLFLAVFAAAEISISLWHGRAAVPLIGYTVADMAEAVAGALLLKAALRHVRGQRAGLLAFAVLPVVVATFFSGLIAGAVQVLLDSRHRTWWYVVGHWWVGDALGVLVVGSVILAWARPVPHDDRPALAAVAAVAAGGAAAIVTSGVVWHYPLVYILFPALVWAAFVGGTRAVATVGAAAALASDWLALTGRAGRLLGTARPGEQIEALQLFLGVTFLTGLVLAVEIAARHRSEHDALSAQWQVAASEQAAVKLAEAERHSITQDTHDIVGHGLNAMLLQLGAVRQLFDNDPATARDLVASAESIGRRACDDLDLALALVGDEPARPPGQGLDQLPELVDRLQTAGLRVGLRTEGDPHGVPTLVDWSAYRIVREALTNVLKHAPGAATTVTVRFGDEAVSLSVVDDGAMPGSLRSYDDGYGILGMRERAAALGGTLDVGHNPGGGFTVSAMLPMTRR